MNNETLCVQGGTYHDAATGGVNTPIFTSSSFELNKGRRPADFLRRLQLIRPAVSLGGVETIVCAPAETSHAKISADERRRIGVSDSLLRLSAGIEHVDDLIADLAQALRGTGRATRRKAYHETL